MKLIKKLLFIGLGIYLVSKIGGYFSILAIYIVSYIAASKNDSLQQEVSAHQLQIMNQFENYLTSIFHSIQPGFVLLFLAISIFSLSGLLALKSVIREWKNALIIKQQQIRN